MKKLFEDIDSWYMNNRSTILNSIDAIDTLVNIVRIAFIDSDYIKFIKRAKYNLKLKKYTLGLTYNEKKDLNKYEAMY